MPAPVNQTTPDEVDGLRARLGFWLRNDASRLLWPARCLVCGESAEDARDLCRACAAALPWNHVACDRCALPLAAPGTCGACLRRPPPLAAVHAACRYGFPLDRLLLRFKFHHDLTAGRLLSQLMAEACTPLPRPDAVIPIPLHRARLRHRGYDQALELARPLARALSLPLLDNVLQRVRATSAQSELDAGARRRNLRNAFAVDGVALRHVLPGHVLLGHVLPGPVLPRHVVLVDDVMTTGATLHAAAAALLRAGVQRVDAWVCARVP